MVSPEKLCFHAVSHGFMWFGYLIWCCGWGIPLASPVEVLVMFLMKDPDLKSCRQRWCKTSWSSLHVQSLSTFLVEVSQSANMLWIIMVTSRNSHFYSVGKFHPTGGSNLRVVSTRANSTISAEVGNNNVSKFYIGMKQVVQPVQRSVWLNTADSWNWRATWWGAHCHSGCGSLYCFAILNLRLSIDGETPWNCKHHHPRVVGGVLVPFIDQPFE